MLSRNRAKRVTAQEFWHAFRQSIDSYLSITPEWIQWYACDRLWTKEISGVIEATTARLGYTRGENEFSSEFYRVDYCCYSFEMLKEGMVTWDLELAIEHENNGRSWHEEWIKLASFNCGLRVVISYAHEIDSISPESPALAKAEILASRRKYAQDAGKWLLILGAAYRESMTTCHFVAFSFDEGGFVKLPDSPIQPSVPSVGPPGPS